MSNTPPTSPDAETSRSCERDATYFAFDLSKHILTIAIACIGFTIGFSYAIPSAFLFWLILFVFGVSVAAGLLFFLRGVGVLYSHKVYDLYEPLLRAYSIVQMLSCLLGIFLICLFLQFSANQPDDARKRSKDEINSFLHSPQNQVKWGNEFSTKKAFVPQSFVCGGSVFLHANV